MSMKSKIVSFFSGIRALLEDDTDLRSEDDWNSSPFTPSGFVGKLPLKFNWVVCSMIFMACIFVLAIGLWIWRLIKWIL